MHEISRNTEDCRIPSSLVPRCPVCGGPMDVNLRKDGNFVQDAHWYESHGRYRSFHAESLPREHAAAGTWRGL